MMNAGGVGRFQETFHQKQVLKKKKRNLTRISTKLLNRYFEFQRHFESCKHKIVYCVNSTAKRLNVALGTPITQTYLSCS